MSKIPYKGPTESKIESEISVWVEQNVEKLIEVHQKGIQGKQWIPRDLKHEQEAIQEYIDNFIKPKLGLSNLRTKIHLIEFIKRNNRAVDSVLIRLQIWNQYLKTYMNKTLNSPRSLFAADNIKKDFECATLIQEITPEFSEGFDDVEVMQNDSNLREDENSLLPKRSLRTCVLKSNLDKEKQQAAKNERNARKVADREAETKARNNEIYAFRQKHLQNLKKESSSNARAQTKFIREIRRVPSETCCCCQSSLFPCAVRNFNLTVLLNNYNSKTKHENFESIEALREVIVGCDSNKICFTCYTKIHSGKIPLINPSSGLMFPEVPSAIKELNDLEERFIFPIIPFMQIRSLKKYALNPQVGCKGAIINIPVNINEMQSILPRQFNDMEVMQVKLKRHLKHFTDYIFETISPAKIMRALKLLIQTPLYKDLGIKVDDQLFGDYDINNLETQINFVVNEKDKEDNFEDEDNFQLNEALIKIVDDIERDQKMNDIDPHPNLIITNVLEPCGDIQNKICEIEYLDNSDESQSEINLEIRKVCEGLNYVEGDDLDHDMNCEEVMVRKNDEEEILQRNSNQIKIIAPGQDKKPIPHSAMNNYDELAFPCVYGGQVLPFEAQGVSYTKRVKYELRHYDRRNCINRVTLFKAKQKQNIMTRNAIRISLRKSFRGNLTVKDVRNKQNLKKLCDNNSAFQFLSTVRTSPAYTHKKGLHAKAMLRQIGIPSIFFTISLAENYSPELIAQMYKNKHKKEISIIEAMQLSFDEKTKLTREDPVLCATFFKNRSNEFIKFVTDENGPFSGYMVTDHFRRREYQLRGTPHDHGMLFIKDAPVFDYKDPNQKNMDSFIEFIDKFITTENQVDHPYMKFQIHTCNQTCRKGKDKSKCRFGFPQFVTPHTVILFPFHAEDRTKERLGNLKPIKEKMQNFRKNPVKQEFEDLLKELKLTEGQYYEALKCSIKTATIFYKRQSTDVNVNTYIKAIMNAWEGNSDFQAVLDPYGAMRYLFDYCFKTDKGMIEVMQKAVQESKEGDDAQFKNLCKVGNAFLNSSLISAQQAADECLGHQMTMFSLSEIFVNTNVPEKRVLMMKPQKELEQLEDDDSDIAHIEFIEKYSKRPQELEEICLADFACCYEKVKVKTAQNDSDSDSNEENQALQSQSKSKYRLRRKPKILRSRNFIKENDPENYYREQVMLYFPWRNEETELLQACCKDVYFDHYKQILEKYAKYNFFSNEELDELQKQVEQDLAEQYAEEGLEFENEELSDSEKIDVFETLNIHPIEGVNFDKTEKAYNISAPVRINYEDISEMMRKLNEKQRAICMHVLHSFKVGKNDEKIVILGSAGTGKSFVINSIYQIH